MWNELIWSELEDVQQVDADQLVLPHADRMALIVEAHGVDRVELICVVEIGVEAVHHHDELLPGSILRRAVAAGESLRALVGAAVRIGVDDEGTVEALADVPLQPELCRYHCHTLRTGV